MGRVSLGHFSAGFSVLFALTLVAAPAAAQTPCVQDVDCAVGESCVVPPCAAVPCLPEGECPDANCEFEGYCVGNPGQVPDECEADGDCPDGFVCEVDLTTCAGAPCLPCACACPDGDEACDCECPECPDPEPCDPIEFHYCVYSPKECASNVDCVEGYECLVQEACSTPGCACDGGCACPPCPDGEDCPPCECDSDPEPCECSEDFEPVCELIGQYCVPAQVACEADGDCPEAFQCATWDAPICACAACSCDPTLPDCDCDPTCDCPAPVPAGGFCTPRSWADAGIPGGAEPQPGEAAAEYAIGQPDGNDDDTPKGGDGVPAVSAGAGSSGCAAGSSSIPADAMLALFLVMVGALMHRRVRCHG